MSNIYIQEPPSHGKVLLKTSIGDIDIELWSREAPKACRNFVQLCMEGYYDGTIFHRVIKDFIAQGGDPTGTGDAGESIYGKPFRDEIHSRLRFVRRGLVAMANAGKDDNSSQFFFTLGPTQELQGKHTIFGKVTGDTVYNLIKFNDIHTDGTDRPVEPPKIKKTEILLNPFDDIIPRQVIKHEKDLEKKKVKSKSRGKKDFKLLSFGDEAEEDEEITNRVTEDLRTSSGKSAHELANDPKLSKAVGDSQPIREESEEEENRQDMEQEETTSQPEVKDTKSDSVSDNSSRLQKLKEERRQLQRDLKESKNRKEEEQSVSNPDSNTGPSAVAEYKLEKAKYLDKKKKLPKTKTSSREDQTLAMLEKFKSKLNTVQTLSDKYGDADEEEEKTEQEKAGDEDEAEEINDDGWLTHKLEFGDAHSKVLDANVTDVDRYEIYDPRNPMTKRRRDAAKKEAKRKRTERNETL